jgi:hypothetical protein
VLIEAGKRADEDGEASGDENDFIVYIATFNINVSITSFMDRVLRYLYALVFDSNDLRLQTRFKSSPRTRDNDFLRMNNELSFAYSELSVYHDANAELAYLEGV